MSLSRLARTGRRLNGEAHGRGYGTSVEGMSGGGFEVLQQAVKDGLARTHG